MMKILVGLLAALALSCGDTPENPECTSNSDCGTGEICEEKVCVIDITQVNIGRFTVDRDTIDLGESVTLEWQITIVEAAEILGSDGSVYAIPSVDLDAGSLTLAPEVSTTYTLQATKADDVATAEVSVRVIRPAAQILEFGVSATEVTRGESVRFHWRSINAESAQILFDQALVVNVDPEEFDEGSWTTSSPTSGTYTLRVTGDDGNFVEESVNITVADLVPNIQSFAATRPSIVRGQSTSLQWSVSDADSVQIRAGATVIHTSSNLNSRVNVEPTQSTTYTLTAISGGEEVQTSLEIDVFEAIQIVRFEGSASEFGAGESVQLSWEVTGEVSHLYIIGDQTTFDIDLADWQSGTLNVTPTASTQFVLVASNEAESKTALFNVTLRGPDPVINSFEANPVLVPTDSFTTLSWSITGATSFSIDDGQQTLNTAGRSIRNGSLPVQVLGPTTYTLTAINADGQATSTVFVDTENVVRIVGFIADPPALEVGGTTTLSWATENATSITLTDTNGNTYNVAGKSPESDSIQVQINQNTTFVLSAGGIGGPDTAIAQALLFQPVDILSFSATPTTINMGESVTFTWSTLNATGIEIRCTSGGQIFNLDLQNTNTDGDSATSVIPDTSTCELVAFGFQGPDVAPVTITVLPQPPVLQNLAIDVQTMMEGRPITISWQTQNATSISLVNAQNQSVSLTGKSPTSDSVTFNADRTTTYTFTASNAAGSDSDQVSITVIPLGALLLNEVHFDPVGGDDNREWIELINLSDEPISLQNFWIGNGGTSYTYTSAQLGGVIPPRGCFVAGGPDSDAGNGAPSIDFAVAFQPTLQNGGVTADAVGLFFGAVTESSVPIDTVLYGVDNTNNLIGEDGLPKTVISTQGLAGESLIRVSEIDLFESGTPTPNRCFAITGISQDTASNLAAGSVEIFGWGLDARLFEIHLGSVELDCIDSTDGLLCSYEAHTEAGLVDLTVSRTRDFQLSGTWQITDRAPADIQSEILVDALTWTN